MRVEMENENELKETIKMLNKLENNQLILEKLDENQKTILLKAKFIYEESKKYKDVPPPTKNLKNLEGKDQYEIAAIIGNTTKEEVKNRWKKFFNN
jgi:antitoxin component HigA of HigAB toxin-antitoxin module